MAMKLALCTSDFFLSVQDSVRLSGHEVVKVWTSTPLDSEFCVETRRFCEEMQACFVTGRVTEGDLKELEAVGVELLISAGYDYKIPTPSLGSLKLINVHGSLLPEGRGPWPQPWILLKYPQFAGLTFHSMTEKWDFGDIVLQKTIPISEDEDLNSLLGKTCLLGRELTTELLSNFGELWNRRHPMRGVGSYWTLPSDTDKTIDFIKSTKDITRIYRAFGEFTLFDDPKTNCKERVRSLSGWRAAHNYTPGTIVGRSISRVVVATIDGFVSFTPQSVASSV